MPLAKVREAIDDIRRGRMLILVDDEDRENEGDFCFAAEHVTPEKINFMAKNGRGLICLSMTDDRLRRLDFPMMVEKNTSRFETAFTVSMDASRGITTGISAYDRAYTIRLAADDHAKPEDFVRPGHLPPPRQARRGSRANGPDRGVGGSCPAGRSETGGRHLRDHEG